MLAKEIYAAVQALNFFANEKLPIKLAYAIARLKKQLEPDFELIEKLRIDLIKQYGHETVPGTWAIEQNSPLLQSYIKEFTAVLETEITLSPIQKLDIMQFGDLTVSPEIVTALYPFISSD